MDYMQSSNSNVYDVANPNLLNGAMFAFMLLITLLITLTPFQYHLTPHFIVTTYFRWSETIENILFFFPLGYTFLAMYGSKKRNGLLAVFLIGLLISGLIEFNQAFIPDRFPSLADVLENTLGAVIGGAILRFLQNSDSAKKLELAFEIPLANIVLLLIPLSWMDAIATGKQVDRLWLLLVLLLIGGMLQIKILVNYLPLRGHIEFRRFFAFASLWFFIAALPALMIFPLRTTLFFMIFILILSLVYHLQKKRFHPDLRFEQSALKQIAPLLVVYLFCLAYWPIVIPKFDFTFVFLPDYVGKSNALTVIFRHMELLTASTLIGYMFGQILNRSRFTLIRVSLFLLGFGFFMVLLSGLHPGQRFSFTTTFLIYFCGLFGALIYQLQLHHFKWKKYELSNQDNTIHIKMMHQVENEFQ